MDDLLVNFFHSTDVWSVCLTSQHPGEFLFVAPLISCLSIFHAALHLLSVTGIHFYFILSWLLVEPVCSSFELKYVYLCQQKTTHLCLKKCPAELLQSFLSSSSGEYQFTMRLVLRGTRYLIGKSMFNQRDKDVVKSGVQQTFFKCTLRNF